MALRKLMSLTKVVAGLLAVSITASSAAGVNPYAAEIISYAAGTNAQTGYTDPCTALGAPSVSVPAWPSGTQDVTMFASAWTTEQVVSIGAGGWLVVKFDHPVTDDPANPFGNDLIIFGNSMFWDSDWPNGLADGADSEPGKIAVSQDGVNWFEVTGAFADGLFPTQAYTDTSTAQGADGSVLSDFTRPVDPNISWDGKTYADILALYDGSGGGTGVDISATGLDWIQYVKVYQDQTDSWSTEIDAFADAAGPSPLEQTIQDITDALDSKIKALEAVDAALAKERAAMKKLKGILDSNEPDDFGLTDADIRKARVLINLARLYEIQSRHKLSESIDRLEDTLDLIAGEDEFSE